ncbi:MAG: hypothetical protein ABJK39_02385 [Hyphomicrobiales bacterium]
MEVDERETGDKHQEVWALLPWYITGKLDADEHEMVERYISTCPLCQKEVAEQKHLAAAVSDRHYLDGAEDQSWQNISALVDAESQQSRSNIAPLKSKPTKPRALTHWATYGLIAASALMAIVIIPNVIKQEGEYETLTDNAVVVGEFLRIKAAEGIGKTSMLALFEAHNLKLLSGPSPTGVYTAQSKSKQNLAPIFAKISNAPEVAFVSHLQGNH